MISCNHFKLDTLYNDTFLKIPIEMIKLESSSLKRRCQLYAVDALRKKDKGWAAVESAFLSRWGNNITKGDPWNVTISTDGLKKIFDGCTMCPSDPSNSTAPTPTPTPTVAPAPVPAQIPTPTPETSFLSKSFEALSTAVTRAANGAREVGGALMTKEVLIPLAITVGVIGLGAIAYNTYSKAKATEEVKQKEPLNPIYLGTGVRVNNRIAKIFAAVSAASVKNKFCK